MPGRAFGSPRRYRQPAPAFADQPRQPLSASSPEGHPCQVGTVGPKGHVLRRDRGQSRDPLRRAASMTVKKQPGATRGLLNDGD